VHDGWQQDVTARVQQPPACCAILGVTPTTPPSTSAAAPSGTSAASASSGLAGAATSRVTADPPSADGSMAGDALFARVRAATRTEPTVVITTSTFGTFMNGTFSYRTGGTDADLHLTQNGHAVRVELLAGVVYFDPGQTVMGKQWVEVEPTDPNPKVKTLVSRVEQVTQAADPRAMSPVGASRVWAASQGPVMDGVSTVAFSWHLTGMQARQLAQRLNLAEPTPSSSPGAVTSATRITVTDVIGHDWLPRRVTMTFVSQGKTTTLTETYSAWGVPVTIHAPSAADTIKSSQIR
jgi:hypothetical protein